MKYLLTITTLYVLLSMSQAWSLPTCEGEESKWHNCEGKVQLIFELHENGTLKKVEIGTESVSSEKLRKSAISALKQTLPLSNSDLILKDKIFEISIIYRISNGRRSKAILKAEREAKLKAE